MSLKSFDNLFWALIGASLALTGCAGESEPEATVAAPQPAAPAAAPVAEPASLEDSIAYPSAAIPTFSTENLARKGFYFAGGDYVGDPPVMGGQMYVEVWEPQEIPQPINLEHHLHHMVRPYSCTITYRY